MEHHAVCYVGKSYAHKMLEPSLERNSTDVHVLVFNDMGIDDARELARQAFLMPAMSTEQHFVVYVERITSEAQNALLKLFEEPPVSTKFTLVVSKLGMLLPTLQSRLFIKQSSTEESQTSEVFESFRESTFGERLELIAQVVKEKNIEMIESLVEGSEKLAHKSNDVALLKSVSFVRTHLGNRGASTKMLLESLAISIPSK